MNIRLGPCGLHLFDRKTGTNILLDEAQIPHEAWHCAPRQVSIALTNACDLSCSYCYAPKHSATLDFSRLTEWIDDLSSAGCLGVGFGGGEPTLYKRLPELCRYVSDQTLMAVTFTTHGHHLNDELMNKLHGSVHFVRVSMDGVGNTYEALRGRSFDNLLSKLRAVRSLCPFGINFLVNSKTISELEAATDVASDLGASEFLLLPQRATSLEDSVSGRVLSELRAWVERYRGTLRLAISELNSDGFPICNPLSSESGLRAYAHIDASGILKRNSYDTNGIPIGAGRILEALECLRGHCKEA